MSQAARTESVSARISRVVELSPRVLGLHVQAPEHFSWTPGQHVALGPPAKGAPRSYYSIASAPLAERPGHFELAAARDSLPEGVRVEEGVEVWLEGPSGRLDATRMRQAAHVALIGMGTGVAPLRAIVQDLVAPDGATPKVVLLQGARTLDELLFAEEFRALSTDNFVYRPVLSCPGHAWGGLRGRVQQHLESYAASAQYCLCGSKQMVDEVRSLLTDKGVTSAQIQAEGY